MEKFGFFSGASNITTSYTSSEEDYGDLDLEEFDDDTSWADDAGRVNAGNSFSDVIIYLLKILQKPEVMGGIEAMLKDSWKFIRVADDFHDIRGYVKDMRLCFIVLTISGYVGILLYLIIICVKKGRAGTRNRMRNYDGESPCSPVRISNIPRPMES